MESKQTELEKISAQRASIVNRILKTEAAIYVNEDNLKKAIRDRKKWDSISLASGFFWVSFVIANFAYFIGCTQAGFSLLQTLLCFFPAEIAGGIVSLGVSKVTENAQNYIINQKDKKVNSIEKQKYRNQDKIAFLKKELEKYNERQLEEFRKQENNNDLENIIDDSFEHEKIENDYEGINDIPINDGPKIRRR